MATSWSWYTVSGMVGPEAEVAVCREVARVSHVVDVRVNAFGETLQVNGGPRMRSEEILAAVRRAGCQAVRRERR